MRESHFNSELTKSLAHWGAWSYKIQDLPASMTMGLRYTPDKPCDILGTYRSKFFAIESKQIKSFEAFGMRHMRPAQIKHLTEIVKTGSRAFVFLNIRIPAIKGKQKRENRLIIFDWAEFSKLEASIKQKEIKDHPFISNQNVDGNIIYDIKPFLESL